MANKYICLVNGKLQETAPTVSSTGTAQAGAIPSLGADGRLDPSVLPPGIGDDVTSIQASEDIAGGSYVNIFDNAGVTEVRLADSTNGRDAHGFVIDSVTTGTPANVFFEGENSGLTGLTAGTRYFLTAMGAVTDVPPTAPTDTISQYLGIAISDTAINTDIDDCIGIIP